MLLRIILQTPKKPILNVRNQSRNHRVRPNSTIQLDVRTGPRIRRAGHAVQWATEAARLAVADGQSGAFDQQPAGPVAVVLRSLLLAALSGKIYGKKTFFYKFLYLSAQVFSVVFLLLSVLFLAIVSLRRTIFRFVFVFCFVLVAVFCAFCTSLSRSLKHKQTQNNIYLRTNEKCEMCHATRHTHRKPVEHRMVVTSDVDGGYRCGSKRHRQSDATTTDEQHRLG